MFNWLYSAPLPIVLPAFIAIFLVISAIGVLLLRPLAAKMFSGEQAWREILTLNLSTCVAFFALLMVLSVYSAAGNLVDARSKVSAEASAIAVLYREVQGFPQPTRGRLETEVKAYTEYIINVSWPQQRRGITPVGAIPLISSIQRTMLSFNPKTPVQQAVQASALSAFKDFVVARRQRVSATAEAIPVVLWVALVAGVLIIIFLTCLLPISTLRVHLLTSCTIALSASLILGVIAVMDHPFRGRIGISPDPYIVLLETRMRH